MLEGALDEPLYGLCVPGSKSHPLRHPNFNSLFLLLFWADLANR